jgi:hypothetical protein
MFHVPSPCAADKIPDDDAVLAMQAAQRDFKTVTRKPKAHPRREEMLAILTDARAPIERINASDR